MTRTTSTMMRCLLPLAIAFTSAPAVTDAATPAQQATITKVRADPAFTDAIAHLDREHDRFVAETIRITQMPAPPFKENKRAALIRAMMVDQELTNAALDEIGNVIALRPGTDPAAKLVVVSAHLDTVFPEGTDVTVRREGDRLYAPGVGDDSRGLATLLAFARALDAAGVRTRHGILFVGTVGEEGAGDLRGVRHLFMKGAYKDRIGSFFSIDGSTPERVTHGAVGSKRYRVTFKGPGGHSFGAFGIVNPLVALSSAVVDLYGIVPPTSPKTTFAASVVGGGTSVNAIPDEVFIDVDMRSSDAAALATLERQFLAIVQAAAKRENAARSTRVGTVTAEAKLIGDRPAGNTPRDADIVGYTEAAVRAVGLEPNFNASSTDSNIPMSLGIPAVTITAGSTGDRSHSLDEFTDVNQAATIKGMSAGLAAILATTKMQLR